MKALLFFIATALCATQSLQAGEEDGYKFKTIASQKTTPVKDQGSTGTCWCFATTSFVESELLRQGKGEYDLSEMFIVRQKYMNQLKDNFQRRGKGSLSEGSITSSWVSAFNQAGIVPEKAYAGITNHSGVHNHKEMTTFMASIAEDAVKMKESSERYNLLLNSLFDIYLGKVPESFMYEGKSYTPQSFAKMLGINTSDFVSITSFTHKPFYRQMEIEVPDNWEHDRMYNVTLTEMIDAMTHALTHGFTICWDGDVSEEGFSHQKGIAINPEETGNGASNFKKPAKEIDVTPEIRQQGYETFQTTDDHLMHVTGLAEDQNGTKYFITKNSWGADSNKNGGYLNMSESYVKAKTIYVMMHKDALPDALKEKLGIK